MRADKGADYAAPVGRHVLAVADGVVDTAEYQNGYGAPAPIFLDTNLGLNHV